MEGLVMQPTNSFVSVLVAADLIVFSFYLSTGIEKHLCVYVYVCESCVRVCVYDNNVHSPSFILSNLYMVLSPTHTLPLVHTLIPVSIQWNNGTEVSHARQTDFTS